MRITPSRWEAVKFVLPYINRGPWIKHEGKSERAVRITFEDFLRPAVEAWRAGEPYAPLIHSIPEYETDLISTYRNLPHIHRGLSPFVRGYSSESDIEVDIVHDDMYASDGDHEIMVVLGFPYFPVGFP